MKFISIILILLLSSTSYALDKNLNASCRISSNNGLQNNYGSGIFFDSDDENYFIFTNSHVASGPCYVEPYKYDSIYKKIPAKTVYNGKVIGHATNDMAILSIKIESVPFKPEIIPLAPRNTKINIGDSIFGAGFPQASWCQAWRGKIIKSEKYAFFFNMVPLGGQSGSGITKIIDGKEYIVGLCTWNFDFNSDGTLDGGGGVNLHAIYEMLDRTHQAHNIAYVNKVADTDRCKLCGKTRAEHYFVHNDDSPLREINEEHSFFCEPKLCPKCGRYHLYKDRQEPYRRSNPPTNDLPDFLKDYNKDSSESEPETEEDNLLEDLFGDEPAIQEPDDWEPLESEIVDSLKKKIEELEAKISNLEAENKRLVEENTELSKLKEQLVSLESRVEKQEKDKESLVSQVEEKQQTILSLEESLSEIREEKEVLKSKIVILQDNKENLSEETQKILEANRSLSVKIEEYKIERKEFRHEIESLKEVVNNLKNRDYADEVIVDDNTEEKGESLFSRFKGWARTKIKSLIFEKLGYIGGAIALSTLGGGLLSGLGYMILRWKFGKKKASIAMRVLTTIRSFWYNKEKPKKEDKTEYNNTEEENTQPTPAPVKEKQKNDCPDLDYGIRPNSRFKDLMALKQKEGQKIEHLAALGNLYKEAVHLLRRNQLQSKPGERFINAYEAASEIENYVNTKMASEVSEITIKQLSKDDLLRRALYGFLYKEAVCKLKKGDFTNIIYSSDIANAIENHVNTRLLQYIETGDIT